MLYMTLLIYEQREHSHMWGSACESFQSVSTIKEEILACASLYLERLCHAFSPTLFVVERIVRQIISRITFFSQKEKHFRERKSSFGSSEISDSKKYTTIVDHFRMKIRWLGLLFVLFKLHKVVSSYLFFSDWDSYRGNKNIYCFLFVFAWIRAGLAERRVRVAWQHSSHMK